MDPAVERTCTAYLDLADRHAPGLVQGLHLQGSLALDDYRPGVSDIDFVAVTAADPDPGALRAVHAGLRHKPYFDGLYVREDDLRRDPGTLPPGPAVHEWRFQPSSTFERNLVTWHVLAQGALAVRGPALEVFTDWPTLAAQTRANLAGYWTRWRRGFATGPAGYSAWATTWGVLGVARLRHTLSAGRITSKTEAAAYALTTYDERWHRIIHEALRIRAGGPPLYRNPFTRHHDMTGFLDHVLAADDG